MSPGSFIGAEAGFWLYVLFAIWIGFAATDLRLAALKRSGYTHAGSVVAEDDMLAERDWLAEVMAR